MRRLALLLPLFVLPSCDFFYGVARRAEPGTGFDAAVAQDIVRRHPDSKPSEGFAWNGQEMLCLVRRGEAEAGVGYSAGREVTVESLWVGRPPAEQVVDESLLLQSELIRMLRERFPNLPPEPEWSVEWVGMDVQDLRVDEVDRVRAQEDLKRAGELGMDPADLWMW